MRGAAIELALSFGDELNQSSMPGENTANNPRYQAR